MKPVKTILLGGVHFLLLFCVLTSLGFGQEDPVVKLAIEMAQTQMRVPKEMEIRFVEKKESPIPDFYSVKLIVVSLTREVPVVVYVDKAGEKAIVGSLFIKGENMTRKESGEPKARKLDMAKFDMDKSPSRGPSEAKVTIVEFSNFECPYCVKSWEKIKEFMEKSPKDLRYVFKHFPFQGPGKTAELSDMAAATQGLGNDAFWMVHDFLFSPEGQAMVKGDKRAVRKRVEGLLKEKGYDLAAYQEALEKGSARKRVEEDIALGKTYQIRGTPTTIINGEMQNQALTDKVLEQYMGKP